MEELPGMTPEDDALATTRRSPAAVPLPRTKSVIEAKPVIVLVILPLELLPEIVIVDPDGL